MVKTFIDGREVQTNSYQVGIMTLLDNAADPTAEGEIARSGNDLKVYAGGKVISLSGITAQNGTSTAAPGVNDDTTAGWSPGSVITDTVAKKAYVCVDATEGAAVWTEITLGDTTIAQSTQAALEAETNEDSYSPPNSLKFAPSSLKGAVTILIAGTIVAGDYNVASIGDDGTGDRNIVNDVDQSTGDYQMVTTTKDSPGNDILPDHQNIQATSFDLRLYEDLGSGNTAALVDSASTTIIAGDL